MRDLVTGHGDQSASETRREHQTGRFVSAEFAH